MSKQPALEPATCQPICWRPARCYHCGRTVQPVGRSVPVEAAGIYCNDECPGYPRPNQRHLWSEHDDTRHYLDPGGWAAHVATCKQCGADDE